MFPIDNHLYSTAYGREAGSHQVQNADKLASFFNLKSVPELFVQSYCCQVIRIDFQSDFLGAPPPGSRMNKVHERFTQPYPPRRWVYGNPETGDLVACIPTAQHCVAKNTIPFYKDVIEVTSSIFCPLLCLLRGKGMRMELLRVPSLLQRAKKIR